jgi:Amt family ammonium transporter
VQPKNATSSLIKVVASAAVGAICFWATGFALAFGEDRGGFIGVGSFARDPHEDWLLHWAYAVLCTTAAAGSFAERTAISGFVVYVVFLTAFIYPVVAHWGWGEGWLSAWGAFPDDKGDARPLFRYDERSNGMIDFAGSGIVHVVGGFSGLVGAIIVGPRVGRFCPETSCAFDLTSGNKCLQAVGTLIIWFAWYFSNCGRTLELASRGDGTDGRLAGKVAVTTTLAASSGTVVCALIGVLVEQELNLTLILNGTLAGLVGITASCIVVEPWHGLLIGGISSVVYYAGRKLLFLLRIDDPCDASIIHGFCGVWGLWATGIFCSDENVRLIPPLTRVTAYECGAAGVVYTDVLLRPRCGGMVMLPKRRCFLIGPVERRPTRICQRSG